MHDESTVRECRGRVQMREYRESIKQDIMKAGIVRQA